MPIKMQIPQDNGLPDDHIRRSYPGEYGSLNPIQQLQSNGLSIQNNGLSLQNSLLQSHLRQLQDGSPRRPAADPSPVPPSMSAGEGGANTLNVRLFVDNAATTHLSRVSARGPGTGIRATGNEDEDGDADGDGDGDGDAAGVVGSDLSIALANHWVDDETRARVLRGKVYSDDSSEAASPCRSDKPGRGRVMMLANVPITQSLVTALSQMSR